MNITELKTAIKNKTSLIWNDPDPILKNDYNITWIEDLDAVEIDQEDDWNHIPILIQYGGGSEAQVFLHEIKTK